MIPYSRQHVTDADVEAVTEVLRSDFLTQGPVGPRFEQAFARRHGVAHAVAVSNATAGLHIGCLALGVGPGSRVWTTPNSFLASANCALYCGASIDFVDMDAGTRNISVAAPIDLLIYRADSFHAECKQRINESDPYYASVRQGWSEGLRQVFSEIPNPDWC